MKHRAVSLVDVVMNKLKNLVAAVDFSAISHNALKQAARIADWNTAKLRLVHVVEAGVTQELAAHEGLDAEDVRARLTEAAKARLREWGDGLQLAGRVTCRVPYGYATDEIVKQVGEVNAGLLVAGVRGLTGGAEGAGVQSSRLVRQAPCHALLVDETHAGGFKKLVAAVDFSPTAREVVGQSLRIAAQDSCEVTFVHVYSAPWRSVHLPDGASYSAAFREGHLADLEQRLREFVGATGPTRVTCRLHHCEQHGRGISEFAREQGADLVIMGTRGNFNLRYALLGSTAEQLLREQPCSLLAIRPQE